VGAYPVFVNVVSPCKRNNVHKYRICCHNNIITKKFIFLTR